MFEIYRNAHMIFKTADWHDVSAFFDGQAETLKVGEMLYVQHKGKTVKVLAP